MNYHLRSFLPAFRTVVSYLGHPGRTIVIVLLCLPLFHYAQTQLYNKGSAIYIQQNGLIHIQGGFTNLSGNVKNDGVMELKGDFENKTGATFGVSTNNSSKDRSVKFIGQGQQYIKGNMSTAGQASFYNLVVDMQHPFDTLETTTPLVVEGSLVFGTANSTTTYNPSSSFTNNNQKGLLKSFSKTNTSSGGPSGNDGGNSGGGNSGNGNGNNVNEFLVDVQNGNPDAISGYPVLETNGLPPSGYVLTSGIRGTALGGLQRKINSATTYVFPVGTYDKGFNGVKLNFSSIPGNGSIKMKFCSGSSAPDGQCGKLNTRCSGCDGHGNQGLGTPTTAGYNRYVSGNDCNGTPQWINFNQTVQNHGYWTFESTNRGYSYDIEVFANSVQTMDNSHSYRVLKHEDTYGADPSLADWGGDIDTLIDDPKDLITYTKNAGCYSGSGVPGGNYKNFSQFTLGEGGGGEALPVTLMFVKAEGEGKHRVKVSWATALEINNSGFFVYRSTDAVNFTELGWVPGHNNSTVVQNYTYDDRVPQNTTYYYKLKQVDNNGVFTYSNIAQVKLSDGLDDVETEYKLYPNPTFNNLFLQVKDPKDEVKVTIYDMNGQVVYNNIYVVEQNGIDQTLTINAATLLQMGTYVVCAETNGRKYSSKFVLQ